MKNKVIFLLIIVSMLFGSRVWANPIPENSEENGVIKPMYIPMEAYIETNKLVYEDSEIIEVTLYCSGGIRSISDPIIYDCTLADSSGNKWDFESEGKTVY